MKNERIVFMGTPSFAKTVLQELLANDFNIVGVVTQPDAFIGRKKVLCASPVKECALEHHLPVFQPQRIRKDFQTVLDWQPDLIVTCAYGQIIPKELLDMPRYHCVNTHASLLPKYRGGAPIQRAIMNGETQTGITIMYMDEKMDEGNILTQESVDILPLETSAELFERLSHIAADLLLKTMDKILSEEPESLKQDNDQATYAYNLNKNDEFISFRKEAHPTLNQIRGCLENPGCYGVIKGEKLKFRCADCDEIIRGQAGELLGLIDGRLAVAAQNGTLFFAEIQPVGKKFMKAADFYNGKGRALQGAFFEEQLPE